jgi:peptide/nickel transport system substrate-binding protein
MRIRTLALFSFLALPPLVGCDARAAPPFRGEDVPPAERYGGTAVIGSTHDIPDVNPLTATDQNAAMMRQFVLFTPLVHYDENFEPAPYLARSWEVSPDTSTLTFHLRDDVFWHDGVRTTAWDVKFAYDLANDPETGFPNRSFFTHYGPAEVLDSFTIRFAMTPHAEFMDPWWSFAPVPRHVLEGTPAAELRAHPFSTTQPLGNGPFRFVQRVRDQSWTFEANPDFPQELGGRPYLDRFVWRVIAEQTTLLTELLTGRIDYYIQPTAEQAAAIEASERARLATFPDRMYVIIAWNQRREPFGDRRVRQALSMAIDKQAIVDGVLYGYGQPARAGVPPFYWQYDPEAGRELDHDPARARQLLAEAGWTPGRDGILRDEHGQRFSFTLNTNFGNKIREDIAQVLQAQLREVGIEVQPRVLEWGTLLDRINNPDRREFDAVLIGWVAEFKIDDTQLFACDRRDEPFQWVGYCDPETDRLMAELQRIPDRDRARSVWHRYQRKIAEDQPYTFLYHSERLEGVSMRLMNVQPDSRGDLVGIHHWWIHPSMR